MVSINWRRGWPIILWSCRPIFLRSLCSMESVEAFFAPPQAVRGMQTLDRSVFRREITLPAIRLQEVAQATKFLQSLKDTVLRYPGIKKFVDIETGDGKKEKFLLLTPDRFLQKPLSEGDISWIGANGGQRTTHTFALEYQHYTMHAILRAVLPTEIEEVPHAFETVGHIAHLNLRQEQLPYKEVIGQVLLDKRKNIRTVVNKSSNIDDTFRFFKMDLLAGEDDMMATVKEGGCTFTFDFSTVYWNSRLRTEHERIVKLLHKGDTVLDVFAGVGPFALPACKKGCVVYANDLNSHSYSALCTNAQQNAVSNKLTAYNMDGREFVETVTRKLLEEKSLNIDTAPQRLGYSHVIMNLPASAVEFLDVFRGLFRVVPVDLRKTVQLPTVHCYCFLKSQVPEEDALKLVEANLGANLPEGSYTISLVRDVAPNKLMMRVSFQLPAEVAFYQFDCPEEKTSLVSSASVEKNESEFSGEPSPKRSRVDQLDEA